MSNPKAPKVLIQKPVYAMASVDGNSAELTMYGDIYESRPTRWNGDPIEGEFVTLSEFLEDLTAIESCKDITIRMNSYGGDAGVSNTIHNRLRELSRGGTKLTCIVDGVAMSGGSLIMCACDTVKANPSSLIMIHKCWSFLWGGYNADELRDQAREQDAWDRMQVEIYTRKTGLSDTKILHMMGDTTYMTGREAKEKGFVDEILEDAEPVSVAASADGRTLFVAGRQMHLAPGQFAPDIIPTVTPEAFTSDMANKNPPAVTGKKEGGNPMTTKELREQYPEQVAEVEAEAKAAVDNTEAISAAVQDERDRLAAIDEVAGLFDPALVQEAKYGEHPCTAAELALKAAQKAAKAGSKFLADAKADAEESGAEKVPASPGEDGEKTMTEADMMAAGEAMAKKIHGKKEG